MNLTVLNYGKHPPYALVDRLSRIPYPDLEEIWDRASWWSAREIPLVLGRKHLYLTSVFAKGERSHFHLMDRLGLIYTFLWQSRNGFAHNFTQDEGIRLRLAQVLHSEPSSNTLLNHIDSEIQSIKIWFDTLSAHRQARSWSELESFRNDKAYKMAIRDGVLILAEEMNKCVDDAGTTLLSEVLHGYDKLLPPSNDLLEKPHFYQVKLIALDRWQANEGDVLTTYGSPATVVEPSRRFKEVLQRYNLVRGLFKTERIWPHMTTNLLKESTLSETPQFPNLGHVKSASVTQTLLDRLQDVINAVGHLMAFFGLELPKQESDVKICTQKIMDEEDLPKKKRGSLKRHLIDIIGAVGWLDFAVQQ